MKTGLWLDLTKMSSVIPFTFNIVTAHVSAENYAQKYQMSSVHTACTPINWPADSQKYDIYINEGGMSELVFGIQQPKANAFRKHRCSTMFPNIRQRLTNKMVNDLRHGHQQAIEEKDAALAHINDDLQERDNQIQAIQYENMALKAQRDVYQAQL